jgi:hypothetical protein
MGPVLFGQLCESLSLNQTLRWLNVSGNCLGPDGGAHLGRLLAVCLVCFLLFPQLHGAIMTQTPAKIWLIYIKRNT